jgi:ABC-type multidrug transport system ATPase subunit
MLFDDPLSAVDPKVAKYIFNDCIKEGCKDKIVILVTHQIQFLEECPLIMLIKDGSSVIGDFDHISASGFNVKDILDSFMALNKGQEQEFVDSDYSNESGDEDFEGQMDENKELLPRNYEVHKKQMERIEKLARQLSKVTRVKVDEKKKM